MCRGHCCSSITQPACTLKRWSRWSRLTARSDGARSSKSTGPRPSSKSMPGHAVSIWPPQVCGSAVTVARLGVGIDLLGRMFDGSGQPIDGGPPIMPEEFWDVNGLPINPAARRYPTEFIETGISTIDGLNTLVRGQKLPIFSGFGLPAGELAADIATHARVAGADADEFVVVFAAMGTTAREASFFRHHLEDSGRLNRTVLFLNLADDPTIERLLTPASGARRPPSTSPSNAASTCS